jgi:hypothetical protein
MLLDLTLHPRSSLQQRLEAFLVLLLLKCSHSTPGAMLVR